MTILVLKCIAGVAVGGALGGALGYFGQCQSGGCPLTSNPWSGAVFGSVFGFILALGLAAK